MTELEELLDARDDLKRKKKEVADDMQREIDELNEQIRPIRQGMKANTVNDQHLRLKAQMDAMQQENINLRGLAATLLRSQDISWRKVGQEIGGISGERARQICGKFTRTARWSKPDDTVDITIGESNE